MINPAQLMCWLDYSFPAQQDNISSLIICWIDHTLLYILSLNVSQGILFIGAPYSLLYPGQPSWGIVSIRFNRQQTHQNFASFIQTSVTVT